MKKDKNMRLDEKEYEFIQMIRALKMIDKEKRIKNDIDKFMDSSNSDYLNYMSVNVLEQIILLID